MERETKIKIGKIILGTVAAAGVITMAILAPNALQALAMFKKDKYHKSKFGYRVKSTVSRLKERGLIEFQNKNGRVFVRLTELGRQKLLKYQLSEAKIQKPRRWDNKWRIIIFDIKEARRNVRNLLRKELVNLGFVRLQNSVWVHPYDCEEIVIMLKASFCIGKDILYIVAEKIENDKWLKKEFGLG